mmetsp:Transcript_13173/g.38308  ORF Transcript_13173/g.38308 Transcript_13173/m.38308 type:complete len:164 (-) Transcript_13173:397-888(-)
MAVSLRTSPAASTATARPSRRHVVTARAGFLQDVGAGIARIFTPMRYENKDEWKGTDTPFTGKISHHGEAGARKPFRDGWSGVPSEANKNATRMEAVEEAVKPAAATPASTESNVVDYVGGAAQRLVSHNFKGDETEPKEWSKAGWSKDVHVRGKDGFHSTKQ